MIDHPMSSRLQAMRIFLLGLSLCAVEVTCYSQPPPTFAQSLQQHHIELTEEALLQALHNPEKEIRSLAASELAEMKVGAALPEILRATQDEKDPQTQVNLAAAATWLGSEEGLKTLIGICRNQAASPFVRIAAARYVFDKQDHSCFPALVELMRPSAGRARIGALSLASQIKPKTEQELQIVVASALDALRDPELGIRFQACEALRWINDPSAIPPLRKAIDDEQDEVVRQQMKYSLTYLETEHPQP